MTHRQDPWLFLSSANVSDALRTHGKAFQAMDGGIRPLQANMRIAGPAFTVRCFPGATWALEQALELAAPGDVLIVDGGGHPDVILMGGLMSMRAQARGLGGAILDAAVRDVDQIISLGFPVFSRHICPRAGTFAQVGEWQTTVCCGRIPVRPKDWIIADQSGITVVPIEMLDEVLEEAIAIHDRETGIEHHLRQGKTLADSAAAASAPIPAPRRNVGAAAPTHAPTR
jgi:4-hydroxy-4-methyl-2-oxoglutarate aldolase